ncbi:hypothetical protein OESDEN_09723 [Oesophagostomum dentatum]|uniref:Uncharacterized protein n=1 Tax=Oesophagostomum dentatum TaxID=61180 RepID=A0A0B1T4V2_OESDE|nr:hypothetical protein OESDEN_09723 [Oesophagostomum dentatum]
MAEERRFLPSVQQSVALLGIYDLFTTWKVGSSLTESFETTGYDLRLLDISELFTQYQFRWLEPTQLRKEEEQLKCRSAPASIVMDLRINRVLPICEGRIDIGVENLTVAALA